MSEEDAASPPLPSEGGAEERGGRGKKKEHFPSKGSIHSQNEKRKAGRKHKTSDTSEGGELHDMTTMKKPSQEHSSSELPQQGSTMSLRGGFDSQSEFNPLDEYSDNELLKLVEQLQNEIRHLRMESLIFLHFLQKNDPSMVEDMENVLRNVEAVKSRVSQTSQSSHRRSFMSRSVISDVNHSRSSSILHSSPMSSSGSVTAGGRDKSSGPKINLTQRTDLLLREMEEIQTNLEILDAKSHITKCHLKAELEEMSIRESELTEAMDLFESGIVVGGVDPISQKIPVDKYLRFMEEWLKSARLTIDKIRLRTSAFKVQYQKVGRQLIEKKELGVNLTEVDFDQLQIENKNLKEKIELKTQLLIEMKRMNGTANLNLTIHKKLLQKKMDEVNKIKEAIKAKEDKVVKLDANCDAVNDEMEAAKDIYYAVKDRVESYTVPDVIDYVKAKAELGVLKKNIKIWTRRKNIKEMALGACVQEIKQITAAATVKPFWFVMPQDSITSSTQSFHFAFEFKKKKMRRRRSSVARPRSRSISVNYNPT